MNAPGAKLSNGLGAPTRKQRRPAVACQSCRRRKIKYELKSGCWCDRQMPCGPCTRAGVNRCTYSTDRRHGLTNAPFKATDTSFSVFERDFGYPCSPPRGSSPNLAATPWVDTDDHAQGTEESDWVGMPDVSGPARPQLNEESASNDDPSASLSLLHPLTGPPLSGAFFKARFYGQSHWMSFAHPPAEIVAIMREHEHGSFSHGHGTFAKCKAVGRVLKSQYSKEVTLLPSLPVRGLLPSRKICDLLIQGYLRTFQPVFGILFVPTFLEYYKAMWSDEESVPDHFRVLVLLVLCIGSSLPAQQAGVTHATAAQWICIASAWLNALQEKKRVNLEGVRIHCLLLLARQTRSIDADTAWLSSGTLIRRAMHIGLHIDPEHHPSFTTMSLVEVESRRRLWATVLELDLQFSMDCGSIPSTDPTYYNCAPPLNVDDDALTGLCGGAKVTPRSMRQFTPTSIQILLMGTIPIRTKIAKFINGFHQTNPFGTTLALSTELSEALKGCMDRLETYRMSALPPTHFQVKLFYLLVSRFTLSLHNPFAIRAMTDPTFYFSRKQCLETSLFLFADSELKDDDFYHLRVCASSMFYGVYTQAIIFLCNELRAQYREDTPHSISGKDVERGQMVKAINHHLALSEARITGGDLKIRIYVLISCLFAQAEAEKSGVPVKGKVDRALKKSLDMCYMLLTSQVHGPLPVDAMIGNEELPDGLDWLQWDDVMAGIE